MHYTYADEIDRTSIHQGDLIARTPAVEEMLREVHPHYYTTDSYRYLIVLTQSCDLVRREGDACAARYITLAAVRPLDLVLRRRLEKYQRTRRHQLEGSFCDEGLRPKLTQFLERLFNNNEDEYFYLHEEPAAELAEAHCAFLALSIAVKAELHYEKLVAAKRLQLSESFQHKLGWLVGKMYSRIGTEDWVPEHRSRDEMKRWIDSTLNGFGILWLSSKDIERLQKMLDREGIPVKPERAAELAGQVRAQRRKKKDVAVETIAKILGDLSVEPAKVASAAKQMKSDPVLASLLAGDV